MNVTINGKEVQAQPDQTILDVVRQHQIDEIPTLCHDPKLPPNGSCYMCVVQVEGMNKLIPSCSSPVADGMVIETDNDKIRSARKTALELLLSNHYADCLGPCQQRCPADVDVQGYVALIAEGRYREAIRLIKETNPLPLVCGRVCVRDCEVGCRRNHVDENVGVDYLKRYVSDLDLDDPWTPELPEKNGKNIAIVGGGPSGLTAAYYLLRKGYGITMYEQSPHLGGMLRYGIPEYRLPKGKLDKEIGWITNMGVDVHTGVSIGKDVPLNSLIEGEFDAVYLAVGAQKAKSMRIPDEDTTPEVLGGVEFLYKVESQKEGLVSGKVIVVGGGNTAIDAARTSRRMGADVTLVYRRTRNEMPAHDMEIVAAEEEGIKLELLSAPVSIIKENGKLKALRCNRMELGEPDESGRRRPVVIEGSEYNVEADYIISAIGQDTDLGGLKDVDALNVTKWNTITVNEDTMQTSIPNVFAGGDVVTGPSVVVEAIAQGKIAAESIDEFVMKGTVTPRHIPFISRKDVFGEVTDDEFADFEKIDREHMPEMPAEQRIYTFDEVELGFTDSQAQHESERCLECGCTEFFDCDLQKYATEYNANVNDIVGEVRKYKLDKRHPLITLDANKCISCGRCVRTCSEVLDVPALGFVNRGFKSVVKPAMEKPLLDTNCIACGNCIATCPTGAITEHMPFVKPGPWKFETVESVCTMCSLGCKIEYKVYEDGLFSVVNHEGGHNNGYLCGKGRFGYHYMMDRTRLHKPLLKVGEAHEKIEWDEAIDRAVTKIKAIAAEHGPESVAVFGSPRMTNEELYLLQKLGRAGIRTNNVASFTNFVNGSELDALGGMLGHTTSTATLDDLDHANVIVLVNADPFEENLIAALRIKAAQKNGAKVVVISSFETPMSKAADIWLDAKRGTTSVLLNAVAAGLPVDESFVKNHTGGYDEFKQSVNGLDIDSAADICGVDPRGLTALRDLLADTSNNAMFVYNIDSLWEKSSGDLNAITNTLLVTGRFGSQGNGVVVLRDYANSQGLFDMGMTSELLPGGIRHGNSKAIERIASAWEAPIDEVFRPADLNEAFEKDTIKAMVIFGEDPMHAPSNMKLFSGVEFMLVADHFMTATAKEADIVLPMSVPSETDGTFTSCDRRVQKNVKIASTKTGYETWQAIAKFLQAFGVQQKDGSIAEITNEIAEVNPYYRGVAPGTFWGNGFMTGPFSTEDGKARFANFAFEITPFNKMKQDYLASENYFNENVKRKLMV